MRCLVFLSLAFFAAAQANTDWSKVTPLDINPVQFTRFGANKPRIVGGSEAKPHSHPHQAGLLIQVGEQTGFCGGSIISKRFILTAAHCADIASKVEVVLGAHFVNEVEPTQKRYTSSKFIVHKGWSPLTLTNDIALIELDEDIEFTDEIQPIRLPRYSDIDKDLTDDSAVISGWGRDSDASNVVSPVLRDVEADIISERKCKVRYFGVIGKNHVCTNGKGGKGACNGDSGGPMVTLEEDGELTQQGLVSFGIAFGCEIGWPSVFTRVGSYVKWINENTGIPIRD